MNRKGISICITSAKGGVGKTIMTLNLAGLYEILKKKVLIIDFDSLNLAFNKSIYNLVLDYTNNQYKNFQDYVTKYDEYIDVLPSPKDPRESRKIDPKYIELILDKAVNNYDIVLIDTNHVLDEFNISTMDLVDKLLLLVTNDPLDIKNMRNLITILKDVNYQNYKVVLNESSAPFKKYFSLYDIKNIIRTNIDYVISKDFYLKNIDTMIMNGKIITLDDKAPNIFSKDYTTLMQLITDLYNEEVQK